MSGSQFQARLDAYRLAKTNVGDDLRRIALRELGDAGRWYTLASINALQKPWITDDPALRGPTVLLAGQDTIKVPASAPAQQSGVVDDATLFGTDLALDANGYLTDDGQGDFGTVTGLENLTAAVQHRIATPLKELVMHQLYGCDIHKRKGQAGDPLTNQLAVSDVNRALKADPRISSTERVTASITGDAIAVTGSAVTVDGRRVPVGVPSSSSSA